MIQSKLVQKLTLNPQFKKHVSAKYVVEFDLPVLSIRLVVFFNITERDEIYINEIGYDTDYSGEYLGVIDAFIALIVSKPLERADRFPAKELDFYLRDSQDNPSFKAYGREFYEVLSIGERLKEAYFGKKDFTFKYDLELYGSFLELSYSEQIEFFEEYCSHFYFAKGIDLNTIELEVDNDSITILSSIDFNIEHFSKVFFIEIKKVKFVNR